jgi:hypothetical protein
MHDYSSRLSGVPDPQPDIDEPSVAPFFVSPQIPFMVPLSANSAAWLNFEDIDSFHDETLYGHYTTIDVPPTESTPITVASLPTGREMLASNQVGLPAELN